MRFIVVVLQVLVVPRRFSHCPPLGVAPVLLPRDILLTHQLFDVVGKGPTAMIRRPASRMRFLTVVMHSSLARISWVIVRNTVGEIRWRASAVWTGRAARMSWWQVRLRQHEVRRRPSRVARKIVVTGRRAMEGHAEGY